jgi:hypothetical protein
LSGCKSIGPWAFGGCSSLREITLADGINIGQNAFSRCLVLTKVILSGNPGEIAPQAFLDYTKKEIIFEKYDIDNKEDFLNRVFPPRVPLYEEFIIIFLHNQNPHDKELWKIVDEKWEMVMPNLVQSTD